MIYILVGDDIYSKNIYFNKISNGLDSLNCNTFYISNLKDFDNMKNQAFSFLNNLSFFGDIKVLKLVCDEDSIVTKSIDFFGSVCNENNILVICVTSCKKTVLSKIKVPVSIHYFENIKSRKECKDYVINNLKMFSFISKEDFNNTLDFIVDSTKLPNSNTYSIEKIISITNLFNNLPTPIKYNDVLTTIFIPTQFNFFNICDSIFYKTSTKEVIQHLEFYYNKFNSNCIEQFYRILIFTIKEYIKYDDGIKTKKYFVFKNSKIKISNPTEFLIEIMELYLSLRFNKSITFLDFKNIIINYLK